MTVNSDVVDGYTN